MNIDKSKLYTLWYENENGDILSQEEYMEREDTEGFIYQHSKFPCTLTHRCQKSILPEEVDNCQHPEEYIKRSFGWIDGIEGRECQMCHGEQTRSTNDPWPEEWRVYGSRELFSGDSTWPEDLVLSMANSKDYSLSESILIAGDCCERCMNALAFKYGLTWGYEENSEEWKKSKTCCEFCK